MNYQETLTYLYNSAPLFQQVGKDAYKEGLENTYALDEYFGHPHQQFRTIHVAGTNGKGSCSHTLAAILQSAGYRVGLYTSPHLTDFRERIRINGVPVPEEFVIGFVEKHRHFFEPLHPSFFELTTAMAFHYFARQAVDVAVIEVGLGGRLDCTNIIHPDVCVITNISFDHIQFLGNTLAQIAGEKAGIIKPHTPVVIGETTPETKPVFLDKALSVDAPIIFAEEEHLLYNASHEANGNYLYQTADYTDLKGELGGLCQEKNTNTLLSALRQLKQTGYRFSETDVRNGFAHVCELTGLQGRWQRLANHPTVICDTGHNVGGIRYIAEQLSRQHYDRLRIVIGMVNDKDIRGVLALLPTDASYYFTQASVKRALPAEEVQKQASAFGLKGNAYPNVKIALKEALAQSGPQDLIFIGGSSFIVADLLATCYTS
ncbi:MULTISPECIES: folylpolyglutamate synthase/dihydrofolate synthase family protein [unclassified Bacteroides]|uniref:bifunctional folylpolyglutamate synthase/dihydrofolate synthase n=1 Tax=unclassified Bacteroides TaxID=2646097 RepID=UPI000B36594C|nr:MULTISPECIES: folylpolyglutamate synthase/dihydrofolate synthase family protein [unclassified Bacteroides]OUN79488.1 dihydrofolate synthase [Bacteroides sp. An51A]OUP32973.1 dihydrofolate synthase [Bacteroides sp. An19]